MLLASWTIQRHDVADDAASKRVVSIFGLPKFTLQASRHRQGHEAATCHHHSTALFSQFFFLCRPPGNCDTSKCRKRGSFNVCKRKFHRTHALQSLFLYRGGDLYNGPAAEPQSTARRLDSRGYRNKASAETLNIRQMQTNWHVLLAKARAHEALQFLTWLSATGAPTCRRS